MINIECKKIETFFYRSEKKNFSTINLCDGNVLGLDHITYFIHNKIS